LPKLKQEIASYTNPLDRWVVFLKGGWDVELVGQGTGSLSHTVQLSTKAEK